ncbi:transglycosylase domain-containing protein [Sphingomonas bacterium]|uniref:transglycosylase domain-containing protein n=1 Tax=Sphingomonas bacterium TaxID=1895847 RepID=UPI001575BCAE|nr:PBP1A family penicillin-binding protein [Sphingomonas bacterium]
MADRDHDLLRPRPTGAQPGYTPIPPPRVAPDGERTTIPLHDRFQDWDAQLAGFGPVEPPPPPRRRTGRWRWFLRGLAALLVLLIVAIGWLAITAPLSKSLEPPTPPSITLTAADGTPIARRGALLGPAVDAKDLPPHVVQAFLAIEDRRFYSHWGIDPHGVARAAWHNLRGGGVREGGSTITQQLAKNAFLDSDRTAGRKIREAMIALWLEAWLTKDQILSRYLSNVYFGDNVYGLSAAAKHYFGRKPADLSIGQAAMLAGLVKAPSKLAPTGNLDGAQAREMVVVNAMVAAHFLTRDEADDVRPQNVLANEPEQLPSGTYFADWVMPEARDEAGEIKTKATVATTLDPRLQRMAEHAVRNAGLRQAQIALVAMRPDGRVVAMVGGKDYGKSPFNRATQARRQPGSTFKLFVYLAAMRAGMTPDSTVLDKPVTMGDWKPHNADGRYAGEITLRQAFARSSNVAAARLTQKVGVKAVIQAARDLGISTPIPNEATIGLGSSSVSLLELTAAFAAVADDRYPVQARGLQDERQKSWYQSLTGGATTMPANIHSEMLDLLGASIRTGTGRQANLPIDAFGKTGTTSDSKDALFVGFAKDLVVGVWVGNDDNTPNPGLSGGGIPARVWRAFMTDALGLRPVVAPVDDAVDPDAIPPDDVGNLIEGTIGGAVDDVVQRATEKVRGLDLRMGNDGSITLRGGRDRPAPTPVPAPTGDQRGRTEE